MIYWHQCNDQNLSIQVEPKNHVPIRPNWCSKLQGAYKKKYNKLEIPGPWSSSNCYLFYDKSFENQTEAQKFCRNAFGLHRHVGELAYGIGISSLGNRNETYHIQPRWKYMNLGILNDIEDSICQCSINDNEYMGLKNDTVCPIPMQNHCSETLYNIATVCELSKLTNFQFPENYDHGLD